MTTATISPDCTIRGDEAYIAERLRRGALLRTVPEASWAPTANYDVTEATVRGALKLLRKALVCAVAGHRVEFMAMYRPVYRECTRCWRLWELR